MMKRTRRKYTQEFKMEAIELASREDVSVAQVERDLGLSKGMLYQWIRKYREEGEQAFCCHGKLHWYAEIRKGSPPGLSVPY